MPLNFDSLETLLTQNTSTVGSVEVFIQALKDELALQFADVAGAQARIDAAFSTLSGNEGRLVAAIQANTP